MGVAAGVSGRSVAGAGWGVRVWAGAAVGDSGVAGKAVGVHARAVLVALFEALVAATLVCACEIAVMVVTWDMAAVTDPETSGVAGTGGVDVVHAVPRIRAVSNAEMME